MVPKVQMDLQVRADHFLLVGLMVQLFLMGRLVQQVHEVLVRHFLLGIQFLHSVHLVLLVHLDLMAQEVH
jgi:hypothetical protein